MCAQTTQKRSSCGTRLPSRAVCADGHATTAGPQARQQKLQSRASSLSSGVDSLEQGLLQNSVQQPPPEAPATPPGGKQVCALPRCAPPIGAEELFSVHCPNTRRPAAAGCCRRCCCCCRSPPTDHRSHCAQVQWSSAPRMSEPSLFRDPAVPRLVQVDEHPGASHCPPLNTPHTDKTFLQLSRLRRAGGTLNQPSRAESASPAP